MMYVFKSRRLAMGLAVWAFLSCAMPQEDPARGTVQIRLPGAEDGRMTFQEYTATLRFFMSFSGPEEVGERELHSGLNKLSLAAGDWSLTLRAADDRGEVARDTKDVSVTQGGTARVDFLFTLKNPYPDEEPPTDVDPPEDDKPPTDVDPPEDEEPPTDDKPPEDDNPPEDEDPPGNEDPPEIGDPPEEEETSLTLTFQAFQDLTPDFDGPTLSRSGSRTASLDIEGDYDSAQWEVYGETLATGPSLVLSLDSADGIPPNYGFNGRHPLTIDVVKDGVPYRKTMFFRVID